MTRIAARATARIFLLALLAPMAAFAAVTDGSTETSPAAVVRDCVDCPELVTIPAGAFEMGAPATEGAAAAVAPDRAEAEQPLHKVQIAKGFAIGRHELTIRNFAEYAKATGFKGKGCWTLAAGEWKMLPDADWRNPGFAVTPDSPAVCLSWTDYQGYLAWLSKRTGATYRLPSEAEWEYVAQLAETGPRIRRAQDPDACKRLNGADMSLKIALGVKWAHFQCDDGHALTAPVGSYGADKLGLYDLYGNVSEFTADCFSPNHEGAPGDGSSRTDENCGAVTLKGGSWAGEPGFFRPAFRVAATKDVRGTGFGIRVVRAE